MRKILFTSLLVLVSIFVKADNLLSNGEFNADNFWVELRTDWKPGVGAASLFTEHLNWNKCLRLDIKRIPEEDGVQKMYALMLLGAEGKTLGFPVKPNTIYQVSLELRGTVPSASIKPTLWNKKTQDTWDGISYVTFETDNAVKVAEDWTIIQGHFKTADDTKRAALGISLWGDSAQQRNFSWKVGQYLLVDNVVVKEKTNLALDAPAVNLSAVSTKKVIALPAENIGDFIEFPIANVKSDKKAETYFSLKQTADAFVLDVECKGDRVASAKQKQNGKSIWADDLVEIFFAPGPQSVGLNSQFVVAAGGGRYMGNGIAELNDYDKWKARTTVNEAGGWSLSAEIPFKLLGYEKAPEAGELLGFNVCRQENKALTSWSNVQSGFHDPDNFNFVLIGTKEAYVKKVLAEFKECPDEAKEVWESFASAKEDIQELYVKADLLRQTIQNINFGKKTFLVGIPDIASDFTLPFNLEFESIRMDDTEPINIRAAVNEVYPLPLTITNRTDKTASYRVIIHPNVEHRYIEKKGLEEGFPGKQIEMYEALAMKDGDNENPTLRFDALPLMNQSKVITVAAGETGLVWTNFDCRDLKPGTYKGSIRVVPLGEAAKMEKVVYYSGPAKEYPLNLEILPIELPMNNPEYPCWLMTTCQTEDIFRQQAKLGGRMIGINPWSFRYTFDEKGEITSGIIFPHVVEEIRKNAAWIDKYPYKGGLKFFVHYDAYTVFQRQFLNKKIKIGSAEWANAWRNNLLGIAAHFAAAGISIDEWGIEVIDEPQGKNIEIDLEACRIARETLPDTFLSITWAAANFGHTPDSIRKFKAYLNDHCFWHGHLQSPDYRELAAEIKKEGGGYSYYACSTSMRESLYRYFRLHPWKGVEFGAELIGLYVFVGAPAGIEGSHNWKIASRGAIAYRSEDDCISSIRMENFRQGLVDIAYLSVLKKLAKGDSETAIKAQKFLEEAPKRAVVKELQNRKVAGQLRKEAIELILKLQKE